MICHGELAAIKPDPQRLTTYYLCISAGSVAGAAFVSFVAPRIFRGLWELPLGLVGTWILLTSSFVIRVPEGMRAGRRLARFAGLATTTAVLGTSVVAYVHASSAANLEVRRDFYVILRVRSVGDDPLRRSHQLMPGYTAHGFQFVDAKRRSLPTAYFTESSGVGLALMNAPGRSGVMRVGVLGLGVGTLVAYGRKGGYRDSGDQAKKILWITSTDKGPNIDGVNISRVGSATWLDQGKPWATFTLEEAHYNPDVSGYIHQKGR